MDAKILILEDEPRWRRRLKNVLARDGYTVETAETPDKAVAQLARISFDAIVADVQMEWWDSGDKRGLDMLEDIDEADRPTAVIVTGKAEKADVRRAFKNIHAVDVVFKVPFNSREFLDAVEEAVTKTRDRRGLRRT